VRVSNERMQAELEAVRRRHVQSLPGRLAEVEEAYARVPPREEVVRSALHRIVGACGTFGLSTVAERARRAEHLAISDIHNRTVMHEALAELRSSVQDAQQCLAAEATGLEAPPSAAPPKQVAFMNPGLRDRFRPMLAGEGVAVTLIGADALHQSRRDLGLIIAGLRELEAAEVCPTQDLEGTISLRAPRIAVIERDAFNLRLAAVRAGAHAVLVEPVELPQLLQVVQDLGSGLRSQLPKVLLVDDDLEFAQDLQRLLSLEGIEIEVVSRIEEVTTALRDRRPDVIVTDLHMPRCDGFELAAVIRQEPSFLSIPIVFLSADQRSATHRAALRHQGDAFVAKSDRIDVVVDVIRTRASRARQLEASITRDGLTGLLRHVPFKERLDEELRRASRRESPLVCGMIDIDHFKGVNDRHGHPVGDAVIRRLARLLQQRFRSSDVLGRYGGEEFVVCLPETSLEDGLRILEELRQSFASEVFEGSGGEPFSATFSAGAAAHPLVRDREQILDRADEALYRAKQNGRNRVERA